jgi:hypothetical protein
MTVITPKDTLLANLTAPGGYPDNHTGAITPSNLRGTQTAQIQSWQQATGVNVQAGSYALQRADFGQLLIFTGSGPATLSLPPGSQASPDFTVFNFWMMVTGTGSVAITPTSATINGLSSLTLNQGQNALVVSDGSNWQAAVSLSRAAGSTTAPQGRLTLTSGMPVSSADATGTTLFYTPSAAGSGVPLNDGSGSFAMTRFPECSQATADLSKSPAAVIANANYDIFAWMDGAVARATRGPAWLNATSRGTGVSTSEIDFTSAYPTNKFGITNGPLAGRGTLVGTIRSNASSQLVDTHLARLVCNAYNIVPRHMSVTDPITGGSWAALGDNAFRVAHGNAANVCNFVVCIPGSFTDTTQPGFYADFTATLGMLSNGGFGVTVPALDWTSGSPVNFGITSIASFAGGSLEGNISGIFRGYAGIGLHIMSWLEFSSSGASIQFFGQSSPPLMWTSGMIGTVWS